MQNSLKDIKGKERKFEYSQIAQKKTQKTSDSIISDSQKKIILHVPEQKETRVLREVSNENNDKILTEIKDLEKKYSSMHAKLEDAGNLEEDETIGVRRDLNEMNQLMGEFEHKKLSMHKHKFQVFIHKLLKKFHQKKKKLILEITEIKKNFDNAIALNKEYLVKIDFFENSYTKILAEYEELKGVKVTLEEDLYKIQRNEIILRTEIEKLKAALLQKEKEYHFYYEKSENLENEKIHLVEENRKFFAKLSKYETENTLFKIEIEKLKENYNERTAELKVTIVELKKTNQVLIDELNEHKKEINMIKIENTNISKERDKYKEDCYEMEMILNERVREINELKHMLDGIDRNPQVQPPPREIITEIPVERIIEKPVEKTVFIENKELIAEFNRVQQEKVLIEQELYGLNEHLRRFSSEYQDILNNMNVWKQKYGDLEFEFGRIGEEKNVLIQRNVDAENYIRELKGKIDMMMNDIHVMQSENQEKNKAMVSYIESLINQNQYLEDLLVSK